jgi:hypothetical protein
MTTSDRVQNPSGESGYFVPPNLPRIAEIVGRHMRTLDLTEDWKSRHSQVQYAAESRIKGLEEQRALDRERWLTLQSQIDLKFAEISEEIAVAKAHVRGFLFAATGIFAAINAIVVLVSHFWH